MAVEILSWPPCVIERGTTVRMKLSTVKSAADWTMAFVINNGAATPLSIAATPDADGKSFDVLLTAAQTTALPLGPAQWGESFTALVGGDVALGRTGSLTVLPGILAAGTPSVAQQNVTAFESAITKAAGKQFVSVQLASGGSHTRFALRDAQEQLVYWQSRVITEQLLLRRLRGERIGGEIGADFAAADSPPVYGYGRGGIL